MFGLSHQRNISTMLRKKTFSFNVNVFCVKCKYKITNNKNLKTDRMGNAYANYSTQMNVKRKYLKKMWTLTN